MDKFYYWIIIIIGVLIYFNSLFNGFVWDDHGQIINNQLLHSLSNIDRFFSGSTFNAGGSGRMVGGYYKPVMTMAFSTIYSLFGPNAFFFHLVQLIFHIANAILVYLLLKKFFTQNISFILALIFLIHPLNVESVAYISALQEPLFFFFGMLAFYVLNIKPAWKKELLICFLLFLSLLSKESGILFVFTVSLYKLFYQRSRIVVYFVILFGFLAGYLFLRFSALGITLNKGIFPSPIMNATFVERLSNIPAILFYYFSKFLFPKDLIIDQQWVIGLVNWPNFYLPLLTLVFLFLTLLFLGINIYQKNHQLGKSYAFFALWLIVGLSLHLQVIPLDMTVADRWFYFPMVGLLGILGITTGYFLSFYHPKLLIKKYLLLSLAVMLLLLAGRTLVRNFDWKDSFTLFDHDIKIAAAGYDLENNYGTVLFQKGNFDEAQLHFEKSIYLAPDFWINWNNLGTVMERKEDYEKAEKYYRKAIGNGHYFLSYQYLANLLLFYKNDPQATKDIAREGLNRFPGNADLWHFLSLAEIKLENNKEALSAAERAYQLSPNPRTGYVYYQLKLGKVVEFE